jgi:1-acyl-sn-glycerol-3-phosphate acyltransferase
MNAPDAPLYYRLLQSVARFLLRLLTRPSVAGLEHVPATGALIVAPNHLHILDTVVLFALLPRRATALAADKWRDTVGGWLMRAFANAIFVARGEVDRRALTRAAAVLREGGMLAVAPEGTRSRAGGLLPGKNGTVYLAGRTGAAILPVALWGQEKMFACWRHGRRPEVHVHFGEPFRLPAGLERARPDELQTYTDELMLTLARLLPVEYRGVYADRVAREE